VGGGTPIQTMVVVAADYAHSGVAFSVGRQMVFMANLPPTYVATLSPMRSVQQR